MSSAQAWWERADPSTFRMINRGGGIRTKYAINTPQGRILHPSLVDIDHFAQSNDSVKSYVDQHVQNFQSAGADEAQARRLAAWDYLVRRLDPERTYSFGDYSRLWNDEAEAAYLRANPDVADAVNSGALSSAFDHYVRYGFGEGRDWRDPETGAPVGERPRPPVDPDAEYKPKDDLQASTLESIRRWNDYVDRFIPLENVFLRRALESESGTALARGQAHAESRFELGDALPEVRTGLASQGVAPGSGRAFMTEASLQSGADVGSGEAQGAMAQGLLDRGIDARMKFSAYGRGLQDNSLLSLHNAADRAADANLSSIYRRANQSSSAMGLMGAIAGGATMGYLNRRSTQPTAQPTQGVSVGGFSPVSTPGGNTWDRI